LIKPGRKLLETRPEGSEKKEGRRGICGKKGGATLVKASGRAVAEIEFSRAKAGASKGQEKEGENKKVATPIF